MTWYDANYGFKKLITIDHTKVSGSSDLSSFPLLISHTDTDLKTTGNGGSVENSNGYDIIFTNSAEDTQLDHEIEAYDGSTGGMVFWVRIPTLSHSSETLLYLYYGNSTISASQENVSGVWDSNYHGVWHLKENAGTSGSLKDSTSNGNHTSPFTTYDTTNGDLSASGKIGTAQSFNGSTNAVARLDSTSVNVTGQNLTLSAWVKRGTSTAGGTIVYHGQPGVGGYVMGVSEAPAGSDVFKVTKYGVADITIGSLPEDTNWHYAVLAGDATSTRVYVDGSLSETDGNNSAWQSASSNLLFGNQDPGDGNLFPWTGSIDEVRLSASTRSADWIATEYANQNDPATFYSVGSAQTNATTSSRTVPATSALLARETRTISSSGTLLATLSHSIPSTAAFQATETRIISTTSALLQTSGRTILATSALLAELSRVVPTTGALLSSLSRTISASATLDTPGTHTRTVPASAALFAALSRTIPASGSLLAVDERAIPAASALLQMDSRTVNANAALLAQRQKAIPASADLQQAGTRTLAASAALLQVASRTILSSATLALARIIPVSVTLLKASTRTIGASTSLASANAVPSATCVLRSGTATCIIRSGSATGIIR